MINMKFYYIKGGIWCSFFFSVFGPFTLFTSMSDSGSGFSNKKKKNLCMLGGGVQISKRKPRKSNYFLFSFPFDSPVSWCYFSIKNLLQLQTSNMHATCSSHRVKRILIEERKSFQIVLLLEKIFKDNSGKIQKKIGPLPRNLKEETHKFLTQYGIFKAYVKADRSIGNWGWY